QKHPEEMERISGTLMFILPLAFCATTTAAQSSNSDGLIEKACEAALYKDFCFSNLKSNPEAQDTDMRGLAMLYVKLVREQATNNTAMKAINQQCKEEYEDLLAEIDDSITAFATNSIHDISTWMSSAMSYVDTCEGELKEAGVTGPEFESNQTLLKLCSSALAVINAWALQ
ncbi:hypothetical protein Ancab_021852, partial [Ancistrocladus abbreviatus]